MITDILYALLVPLLVILGGIILLLAGWLILASLRTRSSRKKPTNTGTGEPKAGEPAPAPSRLGDSAPSVAHGKVAVPFLAAEHTSDGWAVFVKGKRYADLEAVPDPQVREDVVSALRAMAGFARNYVAQQQTRPAQPPSKPEPTTATPEPSPRESPEAGPKLPTSTPLSSRLSRPSSITTGSSTAGTSREILESPTRRVTNPDALIPTIDFAHEIGDIVDELLSQTPDLQNHTVRLTNLPGGGISFAVDGKLYREIDEIPDPAMRDLIRRATREWERR